MKADEAMDFDEVAVIINSYYGEVFFSQAVTAYEVHASDEFLNVKSTLVGFIVA